MKYIWGHCAQFLLKSKHKTLKIFHHCYADIKLAARYEFKVQFYIFDVEAEVKYDRPSCNMQILKSSMNRTMRECQKCLPVKLTRKKLIFIRAYRIRVVIILARQSKILHLQPRNDSISRDMITKYSRMTKAKTWSRKKIVSVKFDANIKPVWMDISEALDCGEFQVILLQTYICIVQLLRSFHGQAR